MKCKLLDVTSVSAKAPSKPLRRVGASAALLPATKQTSGSGSSTTPRISSTAFKTLAQTDEPADSTDTTGWQATTDSSGPGSSSPVRTEPIPLQPTTVHNSVDSGSVPAFRAGVTVNPKSPKAGDYEDVVQALILRAAAEYEGLISTKDAWPTTTLRYKWAVKSWKNANRDAEENYQITAGINSLVRFRHFVIQSLILFIRFVRAAPESVAVRLVSYDLSSSVH